LLGQAFTIAMLGAIEALLSAVVADLVLAVGIGAWYLRSC
jgi:hypothetical protein